MFEWQYPPLGEVTFESKERRGDAVGVSRVYGVDRHEGLTPAAKYQSKDLSKYKVLKPGMFAYNPMRLNIGSIAHCTEEHGIGLVSPDYVVFGCDETEVDPDFFKYVIEGREWIRWTAAAGVGSVRVRIYYKELARMPLTIPPLPEQRAIASILGALDDKIELNRRMNATLESLARAIFKSWFVDFDPVRMKAEGRRMKDEQNSSFSLPISALSLFPSTFQDSELGKIPQGWEVKKWGDIATLEYGKNLKGYRDSAGPIRVWGTNGPIGWHTAALCDSAGIIIGRKGAYRGVHYSPEPFFVIDTAFYLKPKKSFDLMWAYYELREFDINSMDSGSAIPSTSREDFYSISVCVPPNKLLDAFGEVLAPLYAKRHANERESLTLSALRDTLLPKLLSGELPVPAALTATQEALV